MMIAQRTDQVCAQVIIIVSLYVCMGLDHAFALSFAHLLSMKLVPKETTTATK